jgi:molybdenum-dependent DNA-binding transcriptional regulator ModE
MDVDTRLLRYFVAVAAEGSLTHAAKRLFVSQPALTKQVKQLESQLGVLLFTRSRAGMTLTSAGQALANTAPAVLAGFDQALRETKAAANGAARVLRVGFMSSAANEATQEIIAAFARRRPGWRVDMQQAAWSGRCGWLAHRSSVCSACVHERPVGSIRIRTPGRSPGLPNVPGSPRSPGRLPHPDRSVWPADIARLLGLSVEAILTIRAP